MVPETESVSRRQVLAGVAGGAAAGAAVVPVGAAGDASSAGGDGGADDWRMERRDPGGTAYAPDAAGPKSGVRAKWTRSVGRGGVGLAPSPVVAGGTVYAVGSDGLLAVDAATGEVRFRADETPEAAPAVASATAYRAPTLAVIGIGGRLDGLNAAGGLSAFGRRFGLRRWTVPREDDGGFAVQFGFGRSSPAVPVAYRRTAYVVAGELLAVDASSGRVRWTASGYGRRPAAAGGAVYVSTDRGKVTAYDAATGERRWTESVGTRRVGPPTATDDLVLVPRVEGVSALRPDGSEAWTFEFESAHYEGGGVAVGAGGAYLCAEREDGRRRLFALDADTGERRWTGGVRPEAGPVTPAVADGAVYLPTESATAVGVDAETGERLWRFETDGIHGSPVAVSDGTLYVVDDGALYALEEP